MSRVEARTWTEYGVRYTHKIGTHVTGYGTSKAEAESDARNKPSPGQRIELVTRRVTVTAWRAIPAPPTPVSERTDTDA